MNLAIVMLLLLLAAVVVYFVSAPFRAPLRGSAEEPHAESQRHGGGQAELDRLERDELESAREAKYREIRDAELDFRTGKLSRADYDAIDAELRAQALQILDRLGDDRDGDAADTEQ